MRRRGQGPRGPSGMTALALAWATTMVRFFFVDYDAGNDANAGYIDAAPGTVFTTEPDSRKIKTLTRLREIMYYSGAGRICAVLIKPRAGGAMYLDPTGGNDSLIVDGVFGFKNLIVRASDLTNSTTDKITCGGMTVHAGPNGDGSWTVAAGATTSSMTVAAGALPTSNAGAGFRIRFATGTAANLTAPRTTWKLTTATSTIEPTNNFAAAPANGDTFFIEKPSLQVAGIQYLGANGQRLSGTSTIFGRVIFAGINASTQGASIVGAGSMGIAFCNFANPTTTIGILADSGNVIAVIPSYSDEAGTSRTVGGSRCENAIFASNLVGFNFQYGAVAATTGLSSFTRVQSTAIAGFYHSHRIQFVACGLGAVTTTIVNSFVGGLRLGGEGISSQRRIFADVGAGMARAYTMVGTNFTAYGIDFAGAAPSVSLFEAYGNSNGSFNDIVGASTSPYLLDAGSNAGGTFVFGRIAANTVTTATSGVHGSGAYTWTLAEIAAGSFIDFSDNHFQGAAGASIQRRSIGIWFNVPQVAADPGTLRDGDVWFNTTDMRLRVRVAGVTMSSPVFT